MTERKKSTQKYKITIIKWWVKDSSMVENFSCALYWCKTNFNMFNKMEIYRNNVEKKNKWKEKTEKDHNRKMSWWKERRKAKGYFSLDWGWCNYRLRFIFIPFYLYFVSFSFFFNSLLLIFTISMLQSHLVGYW